MTQNYCGYATTPYGPAPLAGARAFASVAVFGH